MGNIDFKVKIAHQKIIREKKAEEDKNNLFGSYWDLLDLSKENAKIKEINRENSLQLILDYEWLGTLPVNFTKFVGLYFDNYLAGVCCFVDVKFGGKFTLYNYEATCLGRGACIHWCPDWGGSYLISKSIKLLYGKLSPRYIIAFSDWNAGEIGTLYQACSWTYLGHKKTKEWIDKDGKRYDINTPSVRAVTGFDRKKDKSLRATKKQRQEQIEIMLKEGYKLIDGSIRGKYATVVGKNCGLKKEMIKLLNKNGKPYPKRNTKN